MSSAPLQIAIVGAGPSGCYLADALGRKLPTAQIDIFDRLPTPFGLVRGGVAPDHQGTKNIARQFERTLSKTGTRFWGNVDIGRDLSIDDLKAAYDIIAVTTGALEDRPLGIAGEGLAGVYGSGAFVGWYNGIPRFRDLAPHLDGKSLAVIGNGNVALDIVRLLAKTEAELANSDLCAHAREAFSAARITDLWLIGRRGPLEASFTSAELAELGQLARLGIAIDGAQLPTGVPPDFPDEQRKLAEKNLEILHGYAAQSSGDKPITLHFLFNAAPVAAHGSPRIENLELERTRVEQGRAFLTGERFQIPVDMLVAAIGYRSEPIPGLPFDIQRSIFAHMQGKVAPGIYTAGWCKRGPQGVVPANRADALAVAELILTDIAEISVGNKPGSAALATKLSQRNSPVVDFSGWQNINAAEVAAGATSGRPREKFTRLDELFAAAQPSSRP
jgi:ferredoxin--NADP+ reductase